MTAASTSSSTVRPSPARDARRSREPRAYDFRRPNKLGRDHVRLLQIAGETFARQMATVLTTTLRVIAQVTVASVDQLTYDEYVRSMSSPTFMAVLSLEPLHGAGVLDLPLRTSMLVVDHLLGGTGSGDQPLRPTSELEVSLARTVVERLLPELAYAFESLAALTPRLTQVEANPRFAQVAASSDMMIVVRLDVHLGNHSDVVTLALPFAALEPVLENAVLANSFGNRDVAAADRFATRLRGRLEHVPVDVSVHFHPARMTPAQLIDLRVGDVVTLPHKLSEPLHVSSSGVTTAYAVPGNKGSALACRIVPAPRPEDQS